MPVNRFCLRSKATFPLGTHSAQLVRDVRLSAGQTGLIGLSAWMGRITCIASTDKIVCHVRIARLDALLPGITEDFLLLARLGSSARLGDSASTYQALVRLSAALSSNSVLVSQLSLKQCFRWLADGWGGCSRISLWCPHAE